MGKGIDMLMDAQLDGPFGCGSCYPLEEMPRTTQRKKPSRTTFAQYNKNVGAYLNSNHCRFAMQGTLHAVARGKELVVASGQVRKERASV